MCGGMGVLRVLKENGIGYLKKSPDPRYFLEKYIFGS